jgi:hypothetical protein
MDEVTPNPAGLKGSMFYKLIQRALPGWFKYDSIYLWQPMYTPDKNIELVIDQKKIKEFTRQPTYTLDEGMKSEDQRKTSA